MNITVNQENKEPAGSRRKISLSFKWAALLLGLFVIYLAGIFANYHQTSSAHSISAVDFAPLLPREAGQAQDVEGMARNSNTLAAKPSIWPAAGTVSSGFGWRNSPWGDGSEYHQGIDIANSADTPVVAAADGRIVQSGWSGGYGNIVQIDHGNALATIYGHNSRVVVSEGQQVKKGQIIAYIGSTGRSTGPHLHYEIRVNGTPVDPLSYLVKY